MSVKKEKEKKKKRRELARPNYSKKVFKSNERLTISKHRIIKKTGRKMIAQVKGTLHLLTA